MMKQANRRKTVTEDSIRNNTDSKSFLLKFQFVLRKHLQKLENLTCVTGCHSFFPDLRIPLLTRYKCFIFNKKSIL